MTPIVPSLLPGVTGGPEWSVGGLGGGAAAPADGASGASGTSFSSMLGKQLGALEQTQTQAADASRALADGTATDPTAAVVAVERAQLSMQLASQLRTKGVDALQELFHTQV